MLFISARHTFAPVLTVYRWGFLFFFISLLIVNIGTLIPNETQQEIPFRTNSCLSHWIGIVNRVLDIWNCFCSNLVCAFFSAFYRSFDKLSSFNIKQMTAYQFNRVTNKSWQFSICWHFNDETIEYSMCAKRSHEINFILFHLFMQNDDVLWWILNWTNATNWKSNERGVANDY